MEADQLDLMIKMALAVRKRAYAPYSKFHVGACVEVNDGSLYSGCNVEIASFGATSCAERTAIFKAISEGKRNFKRIVIVGGFDKVKEFCTPCGICLQVMMEFCDPEKFQVILAKSINEYKVMTLKELLPGGFGPSNLDGYN